jgi:uncharacterized protein YjbI with pentapeptide repeats
MSQVSGTHAGNGKPLAPSGIRNAVAACIVLLAPWNLGPAAAADCRDDPAPNVDWQDCEKHRLMLSGSDLSGANLREANFTSTDFSGAKLTGANLEKATLVRASLAGASADKANFARIEAYRANFSGISAQGASFASGEGQRADFSGANLTGADFEKAELGRANFRKAKITGARFPFANLSRADFREAVFEGPIDFEMAFLFLTRIEGLDLSAATGLTQQQVDLTCGSADTKLPAGLMAPKSWPCAFDFD